MKIESCVLDHMDTYHYSGKNPLLVGSYPPIDTLVFEQSDLVLRPVINYYTTDPQYYILHLHFTNGTVEITAHHKPLIRYVLDCILADVDVLESDIRRHYPELFL